MEAKTSAAAWNSGRHCTAAHHRLWLLMMGPTIIKCTVIRCKLLLEKKCHFYLTQYWPWYWLPGSCNSERKSKWNGKPRPNFNRPQAVISVLGQGQSIGRLEGCCHSKGLRQKASVPSLNTLLEMIVFQKVYRLIGGKVTVPWVPGF